MKEKLKILLFILILFSLSFSLCLADDSWEFKLTHETKQLIESPFFLMTAEDVDKNGLKELIVTDFGRFGDHIEEWKEWKQSSVYNLLILEWDKDKLNLKWRKQWNGTGNFYAFEARQMMTWKIDNRLIVETIPPYLSLEWKNGKYDLHEYQGLYSGMSEESKKFAMLWLETLCYHGTTEARQRPRECLVGIRDFSKKKKPRIVTIAEGEDKDKRHEQTLRVRRFQKGFPIEWELPLDFKNYDYFAPIYLDRFNIDASDMLLIESLNLNDKRTYSRYIFEPDLMNGGYKLKPIKLSSKVLGPLPGVELTLYDYPDIYLTAYDLQDVYLRSTQKKGVEEYWGYRRIDIPNTGRINFILLLRKISLKPDRTGFVKDDIDFPHHDQFLGVGYFNLKDLDCDGLDEIILVEETGKINFVGSESAEYLNIKDYIRILKWDGKKYQSMWVSPPYPKRGTKFLVEDIKNTGKKQLVVMTSNGTIQIWERK